MTENEFQMRLVDRWVTVLSNMKPLPIYAIVFWADVAMRLHGLKPTDKVEPIGLSAFDRMRFELMMTRVGMVKKRGRVGTG